MIINEQSKKYTTYENILKKEMVAATGCTEPIAIAYCAAKARAVLGCIPSRVEIIASGNIIKNAKSVTVPHTAGLKGIKAAATIGIIAGQENKGLEVLSQVNHKQVELLLPYLKQTNITLSPAKSNFALDISIKVFFADSYACVRIVNEHTNIVLVEKDHKVLYQCQPKNKQSQNEPDYSLLSIEDIYNFAINTDLTSLKPILQQQIQYNTAIAEEGLKRNYGANIGSVLLKTYGNAVHNRAKAKAAAGSDARMNGCELPVAINSKSGNQGLTVSLPVIEYAKELNCTNETLYRALIISNLIAIHEKNKIGVLSAYCGAVSAAAAAGAAISYLYGGDYTDIAHTIVNTLAITSGIVCDGAKSSCAAKIAISVEAGILGYQMYVNDQQFYNGDGLVSKDVENTISNIGCLCKDGMRQTDKEILELMTCVD